MYTQYTIFNINTKITLNFPKSAAMRLNFKGLKNEFDSAVVNESSVFEPLKFYCIWGWSGGAMCWVNFQCRGVLLIWNKVGQGLSALAVGAGGGCLDFFLSSFISLFFLPLFGRRPDID